MLTTLYPPPRASQVSDEWRRASYSTRRSFAVPELPHPPASARPRGRSTTSSLLYKPHRAAREQLRARRAKERVGLDGRVAARQRPAVFVFPAAHRPHGVRCPRGRAQVRTKLENTCWHKAAAKAARELMEGAVGRGVRAIEA